MPDKRTAASNSAELATRRKLAPRQLVNVAIAVVVGILVGLILWDPLRLDERAHIEHVTKLTVRSLKADIIADMESEILAVIRFAKLVSFEEKQLQGAWQPDAKLFLADHPSYVAIYWVDPTYNVTWEVLRDVGTLEQQDPASDVSLRPALQAALSAPPGKATLSPAFRLTNGEWGCRIIVPVLKGDQPIGFLVALFEVRKALDVILSDHSELGYAVSILEGNSELYRMHGLSEDKRHFDQDIDIGLHGATWHMRAWPEAELLREVESKLPEVTLGIGFSLGILLVLTIHFARTAQVNSKELQRARDEMEARVEQRTAEVHELSGLLLQSQDEERRRIARELHDSTAQILAGVAFYLEKASSLVKKQSDRADADGQRNLLEALDESTNFLEQAFGEIRTISYLLHPPMLDDLGLEYVVRWFATGFSQRSGIKVDIDLQPEMSRLSQHLELALFRIVQEALTNIHRHSGSPTAKITISRDQTCVTLEVADQGCGIPGGGIGISDDEVTALGVGIRGMRERVRQLGGTLEIASSSTCGTAIRAEFPVVDTEASLTAAPDENDGPQGKGAIIS